MNDFILKNFPKTADGIKTNIQWDQCINTEGMPPNVADFTTELTVFININYYMYKYENIIIIFSDVSLITCLGFYHLLRKKFALKCI